jgi:hypothetical protein
MSFQWIFDNAESMSIERKPMTAVTTARDGTTRTVSRGTPFRRFTVKLPDGFDYATWRSNLLLSEADGRIATDLIQIKYANHRWYYANNPSATIESVRVRCTDFPTWTVIAPGIITWSGPFVFQEATL